MKIIHVLKGKANPNTMNGVNKVVHHLATEQFHAGLDVEVWGITESDDVIRHSHSYPMTIFRSQLIKVVPDSRVVERLDALKLCGEKDVIFHLHSVYIPEIYGLARQLKKRGWRWILSPHGGYAPESKKKNRVLKLIYHRLFESEIISGASLIHAIGFYGEADQFQGCADKKSVVVVPNGCVVPATRKVEWGRGGPLKMIYCGRIAIRHKGLDILLHGMAEAKARGVPISLTIIGDGPDRAKFETLAQECGVREFVEMMGILVGDVKEHEICSGDVFVHASRWEGIPTSVLEAMSMAVPVLISEFTNLGDVVRKEEAGYVSRSLNSSAIADCIERAYKDKLEGEGSVRGNNARKLIVDQFSWADISNHIVQHIYAKALT